MAERVPPDGSGRTGEARALALKLLAARRRTEHELAGRLRQKGFSGEIIEETVGFLKEYGLLDDLAYARGWVESRRGKNGVLRMKRDLLARGIDPVIAGQVLDQVDEEAQFRAALALVEKRLSRSGGTCPLPRLLRFLKSRGFSDAVTGRVARAVSGPGEVCP
ncbi:MAG: recombination regulator RecX [Firmicutes bacterium]|nr:recombination regulator RecX [Bacillota bacterium]